MNWGAVLFCARLRRVCADRRVKTGMFRTKYPRFLAKAPHFSFVAPRFSCAAGECAVRSVERCAVSRPPREDRCRSGLPIGAAGAQKRWGVKNMPGDLSTDGGCRRERGDKMMFFSACDEKNVGGLQKKCTENCFGRDFTNIIFRKSLR